MSIFGNILDKIFHHGAATPSSEPTQASATDATPASAPAPSAPAPSAAPAASQRLSNVDVEATLIRLAAAKGGGGNWRTSIVDLLKLLDLDSSLSARKALAQELNVRAGADGTAEQNIALQKAVWNALAENGGQVPDSLRS
jgi:hypothetical protein